MNFICTILASPRTTTHIKFSQSYMGMVVSDIDIDTPSGVIGLKIFEKVKRNYFPSSIIVLAIE